MFENRKQTAVVLGWAGVVPMAALAVLSVLPAPAWLTELLVGYALLILAFMGGTLWAGALERPADDPAPLLASNALLLAGLPVLLLSPAVACSWLAVLFALHALAEWRWVQRGHGGWYRRLRLMLSASVVTSLLLAAVGFAGRFAGG